MRLLWDCLIFIMEIPILIRCHLYIKLCPIWHARARHLPLPDGAGQVKLPVGKWIWTDFSSLFHISRSKNFRILDVEQVMILRKGKACMSHSNSSGMPIFIQPPSPPPPPPPPPGSFTQIRVKIILFSSESALKICVPWVAIFVYTFRYSRSSVWPRFFGAAFVLNYSDGRFFQYGWLGLSKEKWIPIVLSQLQSTDKWTNFTHKCRAQHPNRPQTFRKLHKVS